MATFLRIRVLNQKGSAIRKTGLQTELAAALSARLCLVINPIQKVFLPPSDELPVEDFLTHRNLWMEPWILTRQW